MCHVKLTSRFVKAMMNVLLSELVITTLSNNNNRNNNNKDSNNATPTLKNNSNNNNTDKKNINLPSECVFTRPGLFDDPPDSLLHCRVPESLSTLHITNHFYNLADH